jgi:superfamily II RNA helicase
MQYKEFTLDKFQEDAVIAIKDKKSVVVSAATGTGKTLIADYAINLYFESGQKIVYTSPIKSLSNQKYRQFKKEFGEDKVGLITGDVVINARADLLIMTVEIYRNMLLISDPIIDEIACVIFDEVHFINDRDRGVIWEESIIFSPDRIRIIALSATIPNYHEFAGWIQSIKKHDVEVIHYDKRVIPLEYSYFETHYGMLDYPNFTKKLKDVKNALYKEHKNLNTYFKKEKRVSFVDLVKILKKEKKVPALFFVFSRKKCESLAEQLIEEMNFDVDKDKIVKIINKEIEQDSDIYKLNTTKLLIKSLKRGVAFHHAGLLPKLKLLVEKLFSEGIIKVLFATETFAVGINMPAKTVVFEALRKFDGVSFRYMKSKEFFQMAGRAGRRGLDKVGYVIPMIDFEVLKFGYIDKLREGDLEPINSMFKLSYNTVINLIRQHTKKESIHILKNSFFQFQNKFKNSKIPNLFERRISVLKRNGYVDENNDLTEKGNFLSKVYTESLVVSEIFTDKNILEYTALELLLLLSMIIYEPGKNDNFKFNKKEIQVGMKILDNYDKDGLVHSYFSSKDGFKLYPFIKAWFEGMSFVELMGHTNLAEGGVIRLFRMVIDLVFQIINASNNDELIERLKYVVYTIEREYIKFEEI